MRAGEGHPAFAVEQQQIAEPAFIERPIAHRPGVDVDEVRMRIPADAAAAHRPGRLHRLRQLGVERDVERPAIHMLAVFGDAEHRARQHRVGFGGAIGGQDRRLGGADRIEDVGEKIEHADIHLRRSAAVKVPQKDAQLANDRLDRPVVVAVGAVKALAGMGVDEPQPAQCRQARHGARRNRPRRAARDYREKLTSVHHRRIIALSRRIARSGAIAHAIFCACTNQLLNDIEPDPGLPAASTAVNVPQNRCSRRSM